MLLFFQKAVPASQSAVPLSVAGYTSENISYADDPAYYSRAEAILTAVPTAGTLTVSVYKNGLALANPMTISPGTHRASVSLDLPINRGDRVQVMATSGGLAPTTEDLLVILT